MRSACCSSELSRPPSSAGPSKLPAARFRAELSPGAPPACPCAKAPNGQRTHPSYVHCYRDGGLRALQSLYCRARVPRGLSLPLTGFQGHRRSQASIVPHMQAALTCISPPNRTDLAEPCAAWANMGSQMGQLQLTSLHYHQAPQPYRRGSSSRQDSLERLLTGDYGRGPIEKRPA